MRTVIKRPKPDGIMFHQLQIPCDAKVMLCIPETVREQMHELVERYKAVQLREIPGLFDGVIASIADVASRYHYLKNRLDDAASGIHSEFLQRAHDSRKYLERWQPTYEAIQTELVAIEEERDQILQKLLADIERAGRISCDDPAWALRMWLSDNA